MDDLGRRGVRGPDHRPGEFRRAFWLGFLTFLRVVVVLVFSTLVWVPVGVKIGLSPAPHRIAQPVGAGAGGLRPTSCSPSPPPPSWRSASGLDVGGIVLMALGAQCYLLFNAIAGAMAIPSDLRDAMDDLGVHGWHRWRRFIIPAIFPAFVTGGSPPRAGRGARRSSPRW
ncbi:MAG: ABC transporter permease subunit [Gammaproteobacteria bacterium]|nr:ABC transporter permease subunit [Gammaproteobacteria bacterium]